MIGGGEVSCTGHDSVLTIRIVSLPMCHSSSYEMYIFLLQANTFQVVIAADVHMTFVLFIYGDIQWGDGANIGFNAGDGTRSFMVQGAMTNQTLNIDEGNNVGVTGLYIYRVDCSVLGPNDSIGKKPVLVAFSKYMLLIFLNTVHLIAVCNVGMV